ncbi:MAG: hypothetical protein IPN17_20210 [Deltaproteobacteria bacterium]|nr:hypothetical protein [Deltaproteobacteria bacterium]
MTTGSNSFQVILTQVRTAGDFDVEFRYLSHCEWTTNDASGGVSNLGGTRPGWQPGPRRRRELPHAPGNILTSNVLNLCGTLLELDPWRERVERCRSKVP